MTAESQKAPPMSTDGNKRQINVHMDEIVALADIVANAKLDKWVTLN